MAITQSIILKLMYIDIMSLNFLATHNFSYYTVYVYIFNYGVYFTVEPPNNYNGHVHWERDLCPLLGGCPYLRGSVMGGSTVYIYNNMHDHYFS